MNIEKQTKLNIWQKSLMLCGIKKKPQPIKQSFLSRQRIAEIIKDAEDAHLKEQFIQNKIYE